MYPVRRSMPRREPYEDELFSRGFRELMVNSVASLRVTGINRVRVPVPEKKMCEAQQKNDLTRFEPPPA